MILEQINSILNSCLTADSPLVPPTLLYNEGWLLRLTLDWFSKHKVTGHPFDFSPGARWFSEALLPTQFKARFRGDKLAESSTHLDGAIGHFAIGAKAKVDLALLPNATQFVAIEAKINSGLAPGVKNAHWYDQAARTVACVAEVLCLANRVPSEMSCLGFYVVAPLSQIPKRNFRKLTERASIRSKVERRVEEYHEAKDQWYSEWFIPTFERMRIDVLTWEEVITEIKKNDAEFGSSLHGFYRKCIEFASRRDL